MKYDDMTATNFIKGRIVEMIFRMMMEEDESHTFTLLPFGYENSLPELAQFSNLIKNRDELKLIRQSPDFILIKDDKSVVYFVEVKYRRVRTDDETLKIAMAISEHWPSSFVFEATQEGFFFDSCKNIIDNNGKIAKLNDKIIKPEIQEKYLIILKSFIRVGNLASAMETNLAR